MKIGAASKALASVDTWLGEFVATARAGHLDAPVAVLSREVAVFGVPGFDDRYRRYAHECGGLCHDAAAIRSACDRQLLFCARDGPHRGWQADRPARRAAA